MAQLLGAMLCAARLNELGGHPLPEMCGSSKCPVGVARRPSFG
jgi:hypothetical protein